MTAAGVPGEGGPEKDPSLLRSRSVQFGYFSHVWNRPGMTPAQRYAQLWRELALADEFGFDYAFAVEHHFSPHESWMPSPAGFCAGAAACTRRLRVCAMGYVAPADGPVRI